MRIAVLRETAPGEARVALVPDVVQRLAKAGHQISNPARGGARRRVHRRRLREGRGPGARVPRRGAHRRGALGAGPLAHHRGDRRGPGGSHPGLDARGGTGRPRSCPRSPRGGSRSSRSSASRASPAPSRWTCSRSQATVAGYKAVLLGAAELGKLPPDAHHRRRHAGPVEGARPRRRRRRAAGHRHRAPARGGGGRLRRPRRAAREQVLSLGATFVGPEVVRRRRGGGRIRQGPRPPRSRQDASGAGRGHSPTQDSWSSPRPRSRARPAPVLIDAKAMVDDMRPGSVVVDLAAETGGNCERHAARGARRAWTGWWSSGPLQARRPRCRCTRARCSAGTCSRWCSTSPQGGALSSTRATRSPRRCSSR